MRILLVDDDQALRTLLHTTFEVADVDVDEADGAESARRRIGAARPDVVVLDVNMPGVTGLQLCEEIKADPATSDIPVILLTGSTGGTSAAAKRVGADAFVRKPFSPLELLAVAERLAGGLYGVPFRATKKRGARPDEALLLYARDLRHMLELERGQRELLQSAYMETVSALASALESKDTGTRAHSQRVESYATALARAVGENAVVEDPSTPYGFLLHDVGKIGIPDGILQKPAPLSAAERRRMQTHTVLGEAMLSGVAFLKGEGLKIVRSHTDLGNRLGEAEALNRLGELATRTADTPQARKHHTQALAIARDLSAAPEEARALEGLGHSDLQDGHPGQAAAHLQQALAIYQRMGVPAARRVQQTIHHHGLTSTGGGPEVRPVQGAAEPS